jgi:hypothetical protein
VRPLVSPPDVVDVQFEQSLFAESEAQLDRSSSFEKFAGEAFFVVIGI